MGTIDSGSRHAVFFTEWARDNAIRSFADLPIRARRGITAAVVAVLVATAAVAFSGGGTATADPSANAWHRLRTCESGNNYRIDTGNDHYGAYQFDVPTWRSVGGRGYPSRASKAEQDMRALILYRERGWQPWQCAGILGLREDRDARTGHISDITLPTSGSSSGSGSGTVRGARIPAFPGGSHWYTYGEWNRHIKAFQDQLHRRGYFPVGTGQYGPHTLRVVKQLQRRNGLVPNGYIGPNTWKLAWVGTYRAP
jgi:hypothetical protein